MLSMIAFALHRFEYATRSCRCEREVYQVMAEDAPDLAIVDMWMETPTSGLSILYWICQTPAIAHIPVIFCTGSVEKLMPFIYSIEDQRGYVLKKPFAVTR